MISCSRDADDDVVEKRVADVKQDSKNDTEEEAD